MHIQEKTQDECEAVQSSTTPPLRSDPAMTYKNFDMRKRKREREREEIGERRGREERERERSMTLKSRTVTHGLEISPCFGMYIDTLILHRVGKWG